MWANTASTVGSSLFLLPTRTHVGTALSNLWTLGRAWVCPGCEGRSGPGGRERHGVAGLALWPRSPNLHLHWALRSGSQHFTDHRPARRPQGVRSSLTGHFPQDVCSSSRLCLCPALRYEALWKQRHPGPRVHPRGAAHGQEHSSPGSLRAESSGGRVGTHCAPLARRWLCTQWNLLWVATELFLWRAASQLRSVLAAAAVVTETTQREGGRALGRPHHCPAAQREGGASEGPGVGGGR